MVGMYGRMVGYTYKQAGGRHIQGIYTTHPTLGGIYWAIHPLRTLSGRHILGYTPLRTSSGRHILGYTPP